MLGTGSSEKAEDSVQLGDSGLGSCTHLRFRQKVALA